LATQECPIHDNMKNAIVQAKETDTLLVMRSLNATHRVLNNAAAHNCLKLEEQKADFDEIFGIISGEKTQKMYDEGDIDVGLVSAGQGMGIIHNIPTIKELFDGMISQAAKITADLHTS